MPGHSGERICWARDLFWFRRGPPRAHVGCSARFPPPAVGGPPPDKRRGGGDEDQKRLCQARDLLMDEIRRSAHATVAPQPRWMAPGSAWAPPAPKVYALKAEKHSARAAPHAHRRWPKDPVPKAAPAQAAPQRRSRPSGCAWPPPSCLTTPEVPPETEEEYKKMYGQGYNMMRQMGYCVGSGCGREGQGSLRSVEAVGHGHHGLGWRSGAKRRRQ